MAWVCCVFPNSTALSSVTGSLYFFGASVGPNSTCVGAPYQIYIALSVTVAARAPRPHRVRDPLLAPGMALPLRLGWCLLWHLVGQWDCLWHWIYHSNHHCPRNCWVSHGIFEEGRRVERSMLSETSSFRASATQVRTPIPSLWPIPVSGDSSESQMTVDFVGDISHRIHVCHIW